jgi:hypothetical protein
MAMLTPFFSGNAQPGPKDKEGSEKIEAWYFHFTTRCMTCRTVEERAKENLQDLYPELWKTGKLTFRAADLNEKEGENLAKTLNVSGQTLLLAKGTKQINLTNEAFLYAVTNPEKYKKIIKEKVDELLK